MSECMPVEIEYAQYPIVPMPMHAIAEVGLIPAESGVYFIWSPSNRYRDGQAIRVMRVAYVGQSASMASRIGRVNASGIASVVHPAAKAGDWVSYIEFSVAQLDFAEAYYIGICKPWRNWPMKKRRPSGTSFEVGQLQTERTMRRLELGVCNE